MSTDQDSILKRAYDLWMSDQALEVGKIIYERLPDEIRPIWAATVLEFALPFVTMRPEMERLLEMVKNKEQRKDAHKLFEVIRSLTLCEERSKAPRSRQATIDFSALYLAENVAKIVYNASNPDDPFDHDTGWWIPVCLSHLIQKIGNGELMEQAWVMLSNAELIKENS